ncbi:hypothetical protein FKM82_017012 [Ascaphus truei]
MCSGKTCQVILLALGYIIYLLAGAAVFQMLEHEAENTTKTETQRHKLAFLTNYTCLTQDALEQLVKVITEAVKQGIYPLGNESISKHSNWDFSSSIFFAGTVVTTIGYGTLAPRTAGGQIFCVFYALFGIPLNVIVLGYVGKSLSLWCGKLGKCLYKRGIQKRRAKILTILFFLVTGILVFLGLPPIVFTRMEGWNYREGVYYAFITLSTIGFGDYVVGSHPDRNYPPYRALVIIWIIFGLAWLALLFNLLTAFLEDAEKKIAKDLLHKKGKTGQVHQEILMEPLKNSGVSEQENAAQKGSCNFNSKDDDKNIIEL